jgi:subtilase family serine protease
VLLGSRAVAALAAGASSTGSVTFTLPAGTATGTYNLFARADSGDVVSETYENNNTRSATLRVGPDLNVTTFTAPATAGIGETFVVSDTTRNSGGGTAAASTTRYYLSANGTLDAGDVPLGSRAVPSLAPGASSAGSASLTIPAGTAGGSYYLIAAADADNVVAETVETNNILNRGIQVGADLTILTFTAPTDGGAGLAITLSDTTRNQGTGTTAPTTTSYYLSVDATFDAGDLLLGSRVVPALASSGQSSGSVTVTIPAGTATGTYTLFARADAGDVVPEAYENNNLSSRTIRVGPDLIVESLSAPTAAGAGTPITLTDTTRNTGAGAAPASTTRIYLSTDWLLDAGDVLLASRAVPALGPNSSNTGSITATIPAATPGGAYYLIVVADGENVVAETQEGNNSLNRNLLIGPDLGMQSLTAPNDAGAGLAITISDTTRNTGGGNAPSTTTSFYLSVDSTLDASDLLLGSRVVPALAAGASHAGSITVTLPATTATGTYTLFARADALDAVAETYENNNTTSRTLRVGPDLMMASLTVPASAGAGATIAVTDSTRNQGGGSAAASTTRFYLSVDALPSADDTALGSRAVPTLAPGATDTGSVSLVIPAGTPGGTYYVIAVADADGVVAETVETNNFTNRSILVGTDLVLSTFTGPTDGGAGLPLTLGDTTRNQGAGTAAPSITSFYLSANATLEAGDVLLGSRSVPALASGASDTGTVSVTLPAGTATGTWYLFAKADAGEVVSEVNESNNVLSRTIRVGPTSRSRASSRLPLRARATRSRSPPSRRTSAAARRPHRPRGSISRPTGCSPRTTCSSERARCRRSRPAPRTTPP